MYDGRFLKAFTRTAAYYMCAMGIAYPRVCDKMVTSTGIT